MAGDTVVITVKTAEKAKQSLSRAIDKKVWLKENRPENIKDEAKFEGMLKLEMDAYEELRLALLGENDANGG